MSQIQLGDEKALLVSKYCVFITALVLKLKNPIPWLALFLPPASIAERLAIAMTILLTLTSMFASERRWEHKLNINNQR